MPYFDAYELRNDYDVLPGGLRSVYNYTCNSNKIISSTIKKDTITRRKRK